MKKILTVLLMILLCFTLASCKKKIEQKDDIYVFFTSDVHCGVDENLTLASVKALVDEAKAEHPYVALVDCGDFIQGGTLGSLSKGELVISIMNEVGYDVVTYGNHEFDYGMDQLKKLQKEMKFKTVASNVKYKGSEGNTFEDVPEYVIMDFDGIKVAFLGLLTPKSTTSSVPANFMENGEIVYDFYKGNNGEDLYARVQSLVDEARKSGARYVVALSHLGSTADCEPFDSISLISHTEGIDAVLDGHSHSTIIEDRYPNKNGEDVVLSSVGMSVEALGELIIGKDGSISAVHITESDKKDEGIISKVDEAYKQLDSILSIEIIDSDHDLSMTDEEGIRMSRSRETTVGNFVADAYRYEMNTDIGVGNGGGVRATIPAGKITYKTLLNVTPFQNELASVKATGQQILDFLEFGAQNTERIYKLDGNAVGEFGGFVSVSGLKYTIDTSIETPVIKDENNTFAGFSGDQRRVKDVYVLENGEYVPIDVNKTYTISGTGFMIFGGGDGNTVLTDCEKIVEIGPVDITAMIDYAKSIEDFSNMYRETEGRITIE